MTKRFFSLHVPVFGSVAMVLLCTVFFLLPFALRGARLGLSDMQNNVADWLPDDYTETKELGEFRKYFYGGDQFVCVSGPWCKEGDARYTNFLRKLREESQEYEKIFKDTQNDEEVEAHRKGDELGLLYDGNFHEDWGEQQEKWLRGRNGKWYFINRRGELYQWEGQNNVVEGGKRFFERIVKGKNKASGKFIRTFGAPPDDAKGIENEFYKNPEKLCCRPFQSVISGPDVFEQMAGPNGTLRIGGLSENDLSTIEAKIEAHKRLTGSLYGPTPSKDFTWTFDSLLAQVDDSLRTQLRSTDLHREVFDEFIEEELNKNFDGDIEELKNATSTKKLEVWYWMWYKLQIEPPARQTCFIVTLNEPVINELARAVGRPMLGKTRGRILELATGECGIEAANLRIGGPPSDNVAIDEEGTSTLLRLVSLSLIIGFSLAYFSFGSVRVAMMLFFVGGTAAISSLSFVWFGGQTMDAILMSMPSLVYVLALSSAVHIVNYYRDACYEDGPDLAVETAVKHSLFPCTLAAFTTALGLISLTTSNLTPIYKFGLFSAIATMATVALLFTYLPSALTVWKPGYKKKNRDELAKESGLTAAVARIWERIGNWVVDHHAVVTVTSVILLAFFAVGATKIQTSVHLLKLFDKDAKILHDYAWMEENLGELVPAEIPVGVDLSAQKEPYLAQLKAEQLAAVAKDSDGEPIEDFTLVFSDEQRMAYDLKYSMLERMELSERVREQLEFYFGPDGMGIVGSGMSTDMFAPLFRIESDEESIERKSYSSQLYSKRDEMLAQAYLAEVGKSNLKRDDREQDLADPNRAGRELWRVSIRLAALNNVDYGQFVNDLKSVVEPIMAAYRDRTTILRRLQEATGIESLNSANVLLIGPDPSGESEDVRTQVANGKSLGEIIDQSKIYSQTLRSLLENRGFKNAVKTKSKKKYFWLSDGDVFGINPEDDAEVAKKKAASSLKFIDQFDCIVRVDEIPAYAVVEKLIADSEIAGGQFVDFRNHRFDVDPKTKLPLAGMKTAKELKDNGQAEIDVTAMYTGIVPIVYKAQRSLLESLIQSIGLAFIMISVVMMLLLRDWRSPVGPGNLLNVRGGMAAMLPNVFPVVVIFGFMGHMNSWFGGSVDSFLVDIGSMMTASVAMGVAVDDTIHFLNWYRNALAQGYRRKEAIKVAYSRVATAMTQTTLIGGLGLAAFALSTFTPTQRFGVLMLFLLAAALVGDLIFLPAILAGPLGKFFGKERPLSEVQLDVETSEPKLLLVGEVADVTTPELPEAEGITERHRRIE
ncbi:MAG: MMPL family transporter [Planctomycetaceae bacterium]|nr:MMPL family transporter [Planctomycetaceae bacterium]MCP4775695.1 MMPL family transporter [Planctomycetaceae bacterium]